MKVQHIIYIYVSCISYFIEPLYQYINHTEFLSTPLMSHIERCNSASSTSSQLEIARQLSYNHRKLWSEQPEVIYE